MRELALLFVLACTTILVFSTMFSEDLVLHKAVLCISTGTTLYLYFERNYLIGILRKHFTDDYDI